MFVYLTDVDEGTGPLTYAPGTNSDGSIKVLPEHFRKEGTMARRSTDEQMRDVFPEESWIMHWHLHSESK